MTRKDVSMVEIEVTSEVSKAKISYEEAIKL